MKIRTFGKSALSLLLVIAFVAGSSVAALAADTKITGEVTVSGGSNAAVLVNGEAVKSGRTIFTSSVISTPADASAVVSVKNLGSLKLAPKTEMVVSFGENGISGSISSGKVTVLNAKDKVMITAPNGKVAALNSGDAVVTAQDDDDDDDKDGSGWWLWALVFGGAAAAIVIAATSTNNRVDLGGGTVVVSPNV
ncbi:MAG: hypothetical protein R2684_05740 [Pyrinomonadaceae bacterium]